MPKSTNRPRIQSKKKLRVIRLETISMKTEKQTILALIEVYRKREIILEERR